ncbi:aminodeoxychorismate/anthranilate synthase component II [Bariatricus massiliensis]|uniref:Aminodeoxychorismate/anthranilate synthase component II n=1 Tax=Bariatricus massiliensis TaxID=1745713 RepID=A0ABS8DJ96_9FIRM|nr:aminodeoxychorismate/anthranilate synthase component II [Bariatricus massiliensis]MCB7305323.1 aminodeoxychorismate/anthranilate synthase component II [Bariatricus massiliensis]MCB7375784.1 aminodeoxychorismate/anthranilate synthase component II [Bariatricus massiliensis]MCB7388466.1 aminodeoxychorismate/anthranilate synthase component II [Bariatricus massiliensis]MCB7412546.1 aminodeoxychorismate/anthranilate synthase component II [Bariatricus massiliensis]MCQ5254816.1 aminodeoxychorismate
MVLLIDNYDSFSYNLVQLAGSINPDIRVIRNDEMDVQEISAMKPEQIILSPGPGYPRDAGVCEEVVKNLQGKVPIMGVCLGHQAICEAYGGHIRHAKKLMHGKQSLIELDCETSLFQGLENTIEAARYHSLAVLEESLPQELIVTARTADGEIMGVRHRKYPVYGLQFHPESILTPKGRAILENFLQEAVR